MDPLEKRGRHHSTSAHSYCAERGLPSPGERLGVLCNGLSKTCLGSFYAQKFKQSISACSMDVVPISERIFQLCNNWFLIYVTSSFTSDISCLNSTSREFHLKLGVNWVPLSPTCQLKLKDHVLFADTTLRVDSQIQQFAWNLEDKSFSKSEVNKVTNILEEISAEGANQPSLADVRGHSMQSKSLPNGFTSSFMWAFSLSLGLSPGFLSSSSHTNGLFSAALSISLPITFGLQITIQHCIIMPSLILLLFKPHCHSHHLHNFTPSSASCCPSFTVSTIWSTCRLCLNQMPALSVVLNCANLNTVLLCKDEHQKLLSFQKCNSKHWKVKCEKDEHLVTLFW